MGIRFEEALGLTPYALEVKLARAEVIAGNLANVDTPGYLARDLDYQAVMADVSAAMQDGDTASGPQGEDLLYRMPFQTAQDGNTVELQVEQGKFAQNSQAFDTSINFLTQQFRGLKTAIEGS
ncbi:flagellar basal body rod protein FlgB [Pseudaeromonas sp. ZJS20]|uniref:flagellar basal body rod protein FlgB n=1 Tax=Pseudaeromonas aegiceratis TaxID=3153928 RepID=UPI00390C4084